MIVTSAEILKKLSNNISDIDKNVWLFKCKIFVVGKRLRNIAEKIGWKDIVTCNYANNQSILKKICQKT
nr:hypothetical protein [Buchnera aphidicola]